MKLAWFAGVDWGSQTHQVCMLDSAGKVRGERAFEHGGAGLSEMADWLLAFAAADEAGEIGVAVETPRGPVVESLMERGFVLHSINPKQLDRFRDRFSPAGAKDDRRDARVLASALRTDPHCLRRLEPTDPAVIELREWSRISEDLTRERTRLANRMREQLWRYYPQFLAAIGDDLAAPWTLALWRSLPTPAAAQRVRETTLAKLLKQHRIRRIDAATLRGRLCVPAVQVAPGAAEAAAAHVRLVAERLVLVNRQRVHARGQLDRLVRQFAEAAPVDTPKASAEAEPRLPEEPPDAAILMSLPGIGTVVLATLLAEASDALRRRDYHALRCLCGVAPVTRRSGKSLIVVRRLAAHDRLRDAAYHWARVAAQRDPASRAKYFNPPQLPQNRATAPRRSPSRPAVRTPRQARAGRSATRRPPRPARSARCLEPFVDAVEAEWDQRVAAVFGSFSSWSRRLRSWAIASLRERALSTRSAAAAPRCFSNRVRSTWSFLQRCTMQSTMAHCTWRCLAWRSAAVCGRWWGWRPGFHPRGGTMPIWSKSWGRKWNVIQVKCDAQLRGPRRGRFCDVCV